MACSTRCEASQNKSWLASDTDSILYLHATPAARDGTREMCATVFSLQGEEHSAVSAACLNRSVLKCKLALQPGVDSMQVNCLSHVNGIGMPLVGPKLRIRRNAQSTPLPICPIC